MTEENRDDVLDEFFRTGFAIGPEGVHSNTTKTIYGTVAFFFDPEQMRELLGSIITDFLWQVENGQPLDLEAINAGEEGDTILDISREFLQEYEQWTEQAMEALSKQLRATLGQTIEEQIKTGAGFAGSIQ